MLDKVEGRRTWKNVNSENGKRMCGKLNSELRRETWTVYVLDGGKTSASKLKN